MRICYTHNRIQRNTKQILLFVDTSVAMGPERVDTNSLTSSEIRKINKPLMEKKRRARINDSLNELKSLVLGALNTDTSRYSKLEKADILEMTVKHLRNAQRQQITGAMVQDRSVVVKYQNGFAECASEVSRYLGTIDGLPTDVRCRLLDHLSFCLQKVSPAQQPQYPPAYGVPSATPAHALPGATALQGATAALPGAPALQGATASLPGSPALLTCMSASGLQFVPTTLPNGQLVFVPAQALPAATPSLYSAHSPRSSDTRGLAASVTRDRLDSCSPDSCRSPGSRRYSSGSDGQYDLSSPEQQGHTHCSPEPAYMSSNPSHMPSDPLGNHRQRCMSSSSLYSEASSSDQDRSSPHSSERSSYALKQQQDLTYVTMSHYEDEVDTRVLCVKSENYLNVDHNANVQSQKPGHIVYDECLKLGHAINDENRASSVNRVQIAQQSSHPVRQEAEVAIVDDDVSMWRPW